MADLYVGLMSGTSLDGVDGVLAEFSGARPHVLAHVAAPLPGGLRSELLALTSAGVDELHRAALAGNALMRVYARVVAQLLERSALAPHSVRAIGAHGQTVRHRPQEFDSSGYTLQLCNAALLAELTGVQVIADFRSRDVAAGGQGAPLAPFFHQAVFGCEGQTVGVLNLGGISNLTLLYDNGTMLGFDCGPANALLDGWCARHQGQPFDAAGAWAASGRPVPGLLAAFRGEPYFHREPPKSTGRDLFNLGWLEGHLTAIRDPLSPADVQATLAELTATTCAEQVIRLAPGMSRLMVCGGGALNAHLMHRLQALLGGIPVTSTGDAGLPPQQVEATAFAWLARKAVRREKLDLTNTTGARGARVLGAIYPA